MRALVGIMILAWVIAVVRAEELPKKASGDRLDFEPELMLQDLALRPEAEEPVNAVSSADLERARLALERARRKAARWQALQKRGVLSRVEAESAALQAVQSAAKFASLRARYLREEVETRREKTTAEDAELVKAETAAQEAKGAAEQAQHELERATAAAAALNLDRHRKLYAAGLISRKQLNRVEAAQQLSAPRAR